MLLRLPFLLWHHHHQSQMRLNERDIFDAADIQNAEVEFRRNVHLAALKIIQIILCILFLWESKIQKKSLSLEKCKLIIIMSLLIIIIFVNRTLNICLHCTHIWHKMMKLMTAAIRFPVLAPSKRTQTQAQCKFRRNYTITIANSNINDMSAFLLPIQF